MADSDDPTLDDLKKEVEALVQGGLVDAQDRDTAVLCLCALYFGCKNIDKLADRTGLSRDKFVRPRAKRMRDSGLWNADGTVSFESADGPDEDGAIEFVLHVLCADGLVECVTRADVPTPAGARRQPDLPTGRWDQLLAWRSKALPTILNAENLAQSLACESLPRADIPPDFDRLVTSFRHLHRTARVAAARSWLNRS